MVDLFDCTAPPREYAFAGFAVYLCEPLPERMHIRFKNRAGAFTNVPSGVSVELDGKPTYWTIRGFEFGPRQVVRVLHQGHPLLEILPQKHSLVRQFAEV